MGKKFYAHRVRLASVIGSSMAEPATPRLVTRLDGPSGNDSVSVNSLTSDAAELRLGRTFFGTSGIPTPPVTVRRRAVRVTPMLGASLTESGDEPFDGCLIRELRRSGESSTEELKADLVARRPMTIVIIILMLSFGQ